mmetsp:Transcript_32051/g.44433  ORF Transcript_32051/g.44433 Transcript_32051/m.44433 type:complete len:242 (-) Transcript_32051:228-953(-)
MEVICKVCRSSPATVLCIIGEATYCNSCEPKIPDSYESKTCPRVPLRSARDTSNVKCDICQSATAIIFCREDRAILCGDCDASIHTLQIACKHTRFLLTGVTLGSNDTSKHNRHDACDSDHSVIDSKRNRNVTEDQTKRVKLNSWGPCDSSTTNLYEHEQGMPIKDSCEGTMTYFEKQESDFTESCAQQTQYDGQRILNSRNKSVEHFTNVYGPGRNDISALVQSEETAQINFESMLSTPV